jgi:hypothetical protein
MKVTFSLHYFVTIISLSIILLSNVVISGAEAIVVSDEDDAQPSTSSVLVTGQLPSSVTTRKSSKRSRKGMIERVLTIIMLL